MENAKSFRNRFNLHFDAVCKPLNLNIYCLDCPVDFNANNKNTILVFMPKSAQALIQLNDWFAGLCA